MTPAPGVTTKQINLFGELLDRKQFPVETDADTLKAQFGTLSRKTASDWIDRALLLPNIAEGDDTGADTPAPF